MAKKNTIPFWLAVAITAIVFLPLTMFLGKYNIPLWVSFIVWAEFFAFGANVKDAGKLILPAFPPERSSAVSAGHSHSHCNRYSPQPVVSGHTGSASVSSWRSS